MRRETQHLILLLVGGAVLKISLNGMYARYVKPSMGPWLTVAGAAAVLLAVALIVRGVRDGTAVADDHGQDHRHGEDPGHWHANRIGWLLMVPALALLFAPPPILSVEQPVAQAATAAGPAPGYGPLPADQRQLRLMDFVGRAIAAPKTLDNRVVELVGFVRKLPEGLYLARVFIWCCVADARALVVRLDLPSDGPGSGLSAQDLVDKQWVRVTAAYVPGSVGNDPDNVPTARVVGIVGIPEPEDPYES